ncbi:DNA binding protein [Gordonia phage Cafasso]|uniref:DNA binding protein n=1 Tax=Gordonia phage Cafasso TaxID=2851095 RepID=A0AAE7VCQ6_9CAUD|nr:DNA binding protein [Gordonia phage Cafasso]
MTPIEKIMSLLDTRDDALLELAHREGRWVAAVHWTELGQPQYPIIVRRETREDALAALAERLPE